MPILSYGEYIDKSQGLPMPTVPDSLTTREDKVNYLVNHFWDSLDFSNAELAEDEAFMEQSMVNYLYFMNFMQENGLGDASAPVQKLMQESRKNGNSYKLIRKLTEKYLYDYTSPMRSEDLYDVFIDAQLSDSTLSQIDKIRLEEQRSLMNLNRPGSKLNDFTFALSDSSQHDFNTYRNGHSNILLIFYDPTCDECLETIQKLGSNDELIKDIGSGEWQVFAIARYDTEYAWRQILPKMPTAWVNGYDIEDVEGIGTFDLPAAPTVISIKPDGTVWQKYAQALEPWLKP